MDLHLDENALWKQRMRSPKISRFSVARNNPSVGLIVTNTDGKDKTYLWNPQTGVIDNKPCLDEDYFASLSPDGKFIHFLKDYKGNHLGHRWRINVETGEAEDLTPDLQDYFGYRTAYSDDSMNFAFIANLGEKVTVYLLQFDVSRRFCGRKTIFASEGGIMKLALSRNGGLIAFSCAEKDNVKSSSILVINTQTCQVFKKFSAGDNAFTYPHMFIPNSTKVVISIEEGSTEKGYIWDYETDLLDELPIENIGNIDIRDISIDGTKLLVCQVSKAKQKFCTYEIASKTSRFLEQIDGTAMMYQFAGNEIFIHNSCSKHKSRIIIFDIETLQRKTTLEQPGSIETTQAHEVCFVGALGDQIHGWLKKPEGKGPFPTIIEVPGGPDCAWDWYEPEAYLEHGFARLYFSYHGGMTFGEEFRKSIIGRVGELELEDMVAARNWLVDQGIANPDQVFLMGGSYGGYLTLLGMVKRPDLWRGGLARVPIADFAMTVEEESGSLRSLDIELFGGTPEQVPERYRKSSPITYVENLAAPLQIIAGKHDTNCPRRQNEAFIAKALSLGKDIEEHWYDEGHSSSSVDEQIHQVELRLKFLKRVLDK